MKSDFQAGTGSGSAGDVTGDATTLAAPECHVSHRPGWVLPRIALDGSRARGTAERSSGTVSADEMKDLRGIVRIWTRLTHRPSDDPSSFATKGHG
ncbi:MAG: hypothetical protein H7039_14505 [Bryobacteraceae bacterium]|nr:hypothetical protein [Bryobacteraceae bacterium]